MTARPLRVMMMVLFWAWSYGAMAQSASPNQQQVLSAEQLDQLLAPIALYSDPLLSEVLMASTYPLEVVQADRWAKSHRSLKGDALTDALSKESWDDSIKSLARVPTVLTMMSDKLDWTQKLGDAVLAQQADVMDSVQRLRARAQSNGKLESNSQQTVNVKSENQQQYIVIEPTSPSEIYVPYYQPAVVYGTWPYPAYPPLYFAPPPGYVTAGALAAGVAFGAGVAVGHAVWGSCNWGGHNINVVNNRSVNINNFNRNEANFTKWQHNAEHRHGVRYNNDAVRQQFARHGDPAERQFRQDFRGKNGEQVLDPDRRDRPNAGDRERQGERNIDRGDRVNRGDGARPGGNRATGAKQRQGAFEQRHSGRATRVQSERGHRSYAGGSATRHAGASRGRGRR